MHDPSRRFLASFLLVTALLFGSPAAAQTTWYVDAHASLPGQGTPAKPFVRISHALLQAATVDGDTILVGPGVYPESIDFVGKTVTVMSRQGRDVTVIDPANSGPCVRFENGEGPNSILEGFELRNGGGAPLPPPETGWIGGGGVLCAMASPTIRECRIRDCGSSTPGLHKGGGFFCWNGSPTLIDVEILDNHARHTGAGAYLVNCGGIQFTRCLIRGNASYRVGGIGTSGSANPPHVLVDCEITDNQAVIVGGMTGQATLTRCRIADNVAALESAGLSGSFTMVECDIVNNRVIPRPTFPPVLTAVGGVRGVSTLIRCNVVGNVGGIAGGLFGCTARDTTIRDNLAVDLPQLGTFDPVGGGGSFCTLVNCRVTNNSARSVAFPGRGGGGGMFMGNARRCLIKGNHAGVGSQTSGTRLDFCTVIGPDTPNVSTTAYNCILQSGGPALDPTSLAEYCLVSGGFPGLGNFDAEPLLWSPVDGLPSIPMEGSPVIDAGDPTIPPDPDGSRVDLGWQVYDPASTFSPSVYCKLLPGASGCLGAVSSSGVPSYGVPAGFVIHAAGIPSGTNGLLFLGSRPASKPFLGGRLCVGTPFVRTPMQASGGVGPCNGQITQPLSSTLLGQLGVQPADTVYSQFWYRTPAATSGVEFTEALGFTLLP